MEYIKVVDVYEKISETTKRLEMTDYLVDLFKSTPPEIIDKVVYLSQGKIYPDFVGTELGVGEKVTLKAISFASGHKESDVKKKLQELGDIGLVAQHFIERKKQMSLFTKPLTVERVYSNFESIAKASGGGAVDLKIKLLADLLHDSKPVEAKYIVRIVNGRLRMGIADMTILDALAIAFARKEQRDIIERAYNLYPDLGWIASVLAKEGIEGVKKIKIKVGVPIRAMLAERLSSIEEIFEKMGGKCAFEYKYDGLRIQAHIAKDGNITLFSRRLENLTSQFPDVSDAVRNAFKAREAVVEGECVPVNIHTGEMMPFQFIAHRRGRKYGIEKAMEEYPVVLFLFDCMYLDGKELVGENYLNRRKALQKAFKETDRVKFSKVLITDRVDEAEKFFQEAIEVGCEGLVAKSIADGSIYRAGARGWLWIKYKRDYRSEMLDTVDLVVVGAFAGHGRRAGTYGALLMAAYNEKEDVFETVCKLGTGFDDETLFSLPDRFKDYQIPHRDARVKSNIEADYWFVPKVVMEVGGAEITLSPVHTCAFGTIREGAGLAIRFPRFTGRWRDDKKAEDATTIEEIIEMYKAQLKKVES
ncbi:MAG: ATP-dependent DNA ligase [Thermoplasmata archaeon]|nr:MAG: ATP-dependent DNA ligase [Thermoplasmata archaeon]